MYTKHATRKTNQWWKCVKRSSTGCRWSLSNTLQNENPVPGQPHHHAPSDTSIKYSKTRNAMKDLATNTRDKPNQIFAQVVSQCDRKRTTWIPTSNSSSPSHLCRCQIGWRVHNYQQPTVPAIRQRSECRKQNVSLLLTREFGKINQWPDLLHLHGRYLLCTSAPI